MTTLLSPQSSNSRRPYIVREDTRLSAGLPIESGQIVQRTTSSTESITAASHLKEQRKKLIHKIKRQVAKQAPLKGVWPERLYRSFARLVLMERGHKMLSYEKYIETTQRGSIEVRQEDGLDQRVAEQTGFGNSENAANFERRISFSEGSKSLQDILNEPWE